MKILNWKGYQIIAWIGQAVLTIFVIAAAVQQIHEKNGLNNNLQIQVLRNSQKLTRPTHNQEWEIAIFTNLPPIDASGILVAELYQEQIITI
ncbi:hypothetical protein HUN01_32525 [Nostoc edaphicum CCNP1411]|uniref:Uncharacterized protein n=1 Tax=Nostoc edaphicum CCNP1411 TaxID=1472755 RepID=A0A7D7QRV5_9NOSO|nr:hypothetical protein [Nostoc edaphicum]QMS92100.1 hypothetical protein HUN01_32525 [Nostoc edaphicum CCNP1411]